MSNGPGGSRVPKGLGGTVHSPQDYSKQPTPKSVTPSTSPGVKQGLGAVFAALAGTSDSKVVRAAGAGVSAGLAGGPWAGVIVGLITWWQGTEARKKQKKEARYATQLDVRLEGTDAGRAIQLLYGRNEAILYRAYARPGNSVPVEYNVLSAAGPAGTYPYRIGNLSQGNAQNRKDNRIWGSQHVITMGPCDQLVNITVNGRFTTDKLFNNRLWIKQRYNEAEPIMTAFEDPNAMVGSYKGSGLRLRDATATFTGLSYISLFWYHAHEDRNLSLPLTIKGYGKLKRIRSLKKTGNVYSVDTDNNATSDSNTIKVLFDRLVGGPLGHYSCGVTVDGIDLPSFYAAQEVAGVSSDKTIQIKWPTGTSYAETIDTNNPWGRLQGLGEDVDYNEADYNATTGVATPQVTLKRYEYNGPVNTEEPFLDNLQDIIDTAPGLIMFQNDDGKLALSMPDATTPEATQSVLHITDADIVDGGATQVAVPDAQSLLNSITGRYIDNMNGSAINTLEFPQQGSALDTQLKARDRNVLLPTEVELEGTDNIFHATDILDTALSLSRRRIYTTEVGLVGELLEPGDVYTITDTRAGIRGIHCRLLQQPEWASESTVRITGIYFDRTDYAQSFDLATASFNAQVFPENVLLPPIAVAASFSIATGLVSATWQEPDNQSSIHDGYDIERKVDDDDWKGVTSLGEDQLSYSETPPPGSHSINYRVRSRDQNDDISDWVESGAVRVITIRPNVISGPIPGGCPPVSAESNPKGIVYEANDGSGKRFQLDESLWDGTNPVGLLAKGSDKPLTIDANTFTLNANARRGFFLAGNSLVGIHFMGTADRTDLTRIRVEVDGSIGARVNDTPANPADVAVAFRDPFGEHGSQRLRSLTETSPDGFSDLRRYFTGDITDSAREFLDNIIKILPGQTTDRKNTDNVRFRPPATLLLPATWIVSSARDIRQMQIKSDGRIALFLRGDTLTERMERDLRIIIRKRSDGSTLNFPGPNAAVNKTQDDEGGIYTWTPEQSIQTAAVAFYTASAVGDIWDVMFYDDQAESPLDFALAEADKRCPENVASAFLLTDEGTEIGAGYFETDIFQARPIGTNAPAVPTGATFNIATRAWNHLGAWGTRRPTFDLNTHELWVAGVAGHSEDAADGLVAFGAADWGTPVIIAASGDLDYVYRSFDRVATLADTPPSGITFPPTGWHDSPEDVPPSNGRINQVKGTRQNSTAVWNYHGPPTVFQGDDGVSVDATPAILFTARTNPSVSGNWEPDWGRVRGRWLRTGNVECELAVDFDMNYPDGTPISGSRPLPNLVRGRAGELVGGYQNADPNLAPLDSTTGISETFKGSCYRFGGSGAWTRIDISGMPAATALVQTLGTAPTGSNTDRRLYYNGNTFGTSDRCVIGTYLGQEICLRAEAFTAATESEALKLTYAESSSATEWQINRAITPLSPTVENSDGTTLTYTMLRAPAGVTISAAGIISGTPTATGTATITVKVVDGADNEDSVTFRWQVSSQRRIIKRASALRLGLTGTTYTMTAGQTLSRTLPAATGGSGIKTYTLTGQPASMVFTASTRGLRGTINVAGTHRATYRVSDGGGDTAETTITFNVVAPVTSPPVAPGGLTATPGVGGVLFSWNPVTGADLYFLRVSVTGRIFPIKTRTGSTSYHYVGTTGDEVRFSVSARVGGYIGNANFINSRAG